MSAMKKEIVIIDVTRGDCLEANRKTGKSNTGTYFVSSIKDFDNFKSYFKDENKFFIDLKKVKEYQILFNYFFAKYLNEYIGKGTKIDTYFNFLLSLNKNPNVEVTLRVNDSRVFMRFKDNSNVIVNAFRNLLYEDLSFICIEKRKGEIFIFPVINSAKINAISFVNNEGLILDE